MRALFFLDTPHRVAGAQRSLLAAVTQARELGLDPLMVLPTDGLFGDTCRAAGLETRVLEGGAAFRSFGKALLRLGPFGKAAVLVRDLAPYAVSLARLIDRERIDVVHFNTARGAIMAGGGAHLSGRGLVLHVRGTPGITSALWMSGQAMATRLILVARALERYLLPSARSRARVVYNGVRIGEPRSRDDARAALTEMGIGNDDLARPVVLSLSSLVPFKGLHHLIRAATLLKSRDIDATFLLAGTGLGDDYERYLRALPEALGVGDRVRFLGHVPEPLGVLPGADLLALPSVEREIFQFNDPPLAAIEPTKTLDVLGNEGLPRSILEAMASGLPVVATDIAGVKEQVEDGVTGYVVRPADPGALADAIARTLASPGFRAAAGARGRDVVAARFTVEAAARGLVDVLEEARHAARPGDVLRFSSSALVEGASVWRQSS